MDFSLNWLFVVVAVMCIILVIMVSGLIILEHLRRRMEKQFEVFMFGVDDPAPRVEPRPIPAPRLEHSSEMSAEARRLAFLRADIAQTIANENKLIK